MTLRSPGALRGTVLVCLGQRWPRHSIRQAAASVESDVCATNGLDSMQETFADTCGGAQGTRENPAAELAQILDRADFSHNLPQEAGFAHCFWPLIDDGIQRLREQSALLEQQYSPFPVELEAFLKSCIPDLLGRVKLLVSRTMVLELNVARLQERLHGETAEERFRDFVRQMQVKDNLVLLLAEYPVLARLLLLTIE